LSIQNLLIQENINFIIFKNLVNNFQCALINNFLLAVSIYYAIKLAKNNISKFYIFPQIIIETIENSNQLLLIVFCPVDTFACSTVVKYSTFNDSLMAVSKSLKVFSRLVHINNK